MEYEVVFIKSMIRGVCCVVFLVAVGFWVILIVQVLIYLIGVYLGINSVRETECSDKFLRAHHRGNTSEIPKHIHQIFFHVDQNTMSKAWLSSQKTWLQQNPDYKYTLWDSYKFLDLLQTHYPELVDLYHAYGHWIMRIDVARLLILYHYGGVYADLDVQSKRPMASLYQSFAKADTILYYSNSVGVSSDFIVSKSGSPFIVHVLCGLEHAQRRYVLPYVTVMLSAGPMHIYIRYLIYGRKDDVTILDDASAYLGHVDGRSWHQWDGAAIWWIFDNRSQLMWGFFIISGVALLLIICRRICMGKLDLYMQYRNNKKIR